ncbi:PHB depolymerase family esterase [Psychrosphaera ytuae]|uniref:PHB depolymerase family esterase n=1 Tax=Psychrosphaera ytuae TaxID=2820710 RepID=A0A975DD17_9GAMM|nr:PHB depolymerase family esterase [Psychrosphaera ytuae]QTH64479.1 PHB depolymerase family esterase [Psychrosphaera ytuae]
MKTTHMFNAGIDYVDFRFSNRVRKLVLIVVTFLIALPNYSVAAKSDSVATWNESLIPIQIAPKLNPGELTASLYKVTNAQNLVVLLHGCGQSAIDFANHGGFYAMARRFEANLLLIQQSQQNNPQGCFNWFSEHDTTVGKGEYASIMAFVFQAEKQLTSPQARFLIGLSAGAAMANALYAQQPEQFDGLAVVAGIPFPCAQSLVQAISCMKVGPNQSGKAMAQSAMSSGSNTLGSNLTRGNHVIVITGTGDRIVSPNNSELTVSQYKHLLGLTELPSKQEGDGYSKMIYHQTDSKIPAQIDYYQVLDMDHGLPVDSRTLSGERAAPYFLDVGFSASSSIFSTWFGARKNNASS